MINLGFIGCGFVAQQVHLPCFSSDPNFNIHALADPFADTRDYISSRYQIGTCYSHHSDLLKDPNIDAVVVTLPRRLTFNVVQDALLASKHVFTEKPLCLNSTNGQLLLDLALSAKKVVQVGYMKIHDTGTLYFKSLIDELDFADIKLIRAYSHMGDSYCSPFGDFKGMNMDSNIPSAQEEDFPEWLSSTHHRSYEQFLNVHSHILHSAEFITSRPITLTHSVCNLSAEGFFSGSINTTPFALEAVRGQQLQWSEGLSIKTTSGYYEIKYQPPFLRNSPAEVIVTSGDNNITQTFYQPKWSWSFKNQAAYFAHLLHSSDSSLSNLRRAINQVKLAESVFSMSPFSNE